MDQFQVLQLLCHWLSHHIGVCNLSVQATYYMWADMELNGASRMYVSDAFYAKLNFHEFVLPRKMRHILSY